MDIASLDWNENQLNDRFQGAPAVGKWGRLELHLFLLLPYLTHFVNDLVEITKFGNGSKIGKVDNVMTLNVGYVVTWADEPGSLFSTYKYQVHDLLALLTGCWTLSCCTVTQKHLGLLVENEAECAPRMHRRQQESAVQLFSCCPWRVEQNKAYQCFINILV